MQRYQQIFDQAETAQICGSLDGHVTEANAAMGRLLGYDSAALLGRPITDLSHPDDVAGLASALGELVAGGPSVRFDTRAVHRNGGVLWLEVAASMIQARAEAAVIHATLSDVTERVRGAQMLEARFSLMRYAEDHSLHDLLVRVLDTVTALTESAVGFYRFVAADQTSSTVRAMSSDTTRLLYESHGDVLGSVAGIEGGWRVALRERRPAVSNAPSGPLARELVVPIERRGVVVALLAVGNKARDYTEADVAVVRYLADVAWEISARNQGEEDLRLLHMAVEQSPASVVITDRDGKIEYVNSKFCQVTGYTADEARGNNPRILRSETTPPSVYEELWKTIVRGDVWRGQLCNKRKDGTHYWENVSISPVRQDGAAPTHFIAVKEDVTAQRALEMQLLHAQKLEAVGQLAAGIAHEINTPTQFASDSVHFLAEALEDLLAVVDAQRAAIDLLPGDPAREQAMYALADAEERADIEYLRVHGPEAIAMSIDGLTRIATIVRAMKEFSHPTQGDKSPADINAALESTLTIARNEFKYVAEVERDFAPLPMIPCVIGELNQVFLNLIVNAAHAIADVVGTGGTKGIIRITTRADARGVLVEIGDTGSGVPEEARPHLFEPFFTTKPVGKGTGQGLAIARSIVVNKHGGELTFESEVGKGSVFRVRLPLEAATPPSREPR